MAHYQPGPAPHHFCSAPALECVGAIDQGTQSSRFTLYNAAAEPIASSQVPLPQIYPRAG